VKEYLATLDATAFGAASEVTPKFVSLSDPAAQWTGAQRGPAFFAYSDNYLIDVKVGVIMDVEASRAIRQAEVGAEQTMIERTEERFDIKPGWLAGDTAYGSGSNLNWLVNDKDIAPGDRQVEARRWNLQPGRLQVRQGAQHLYLPGGQNPDDDWQAGQRRGDTSLSLSHARLSRLPVQGTMLSKDAFPQDPAQHLRAGA